MRNPGHHRCRGVLWTHRTWLLLCALLSASCNSDPPEAAETGQDSPGESASSDDTEPSIDFPAFQPSEPTGDGEDGNLRYQTRASVEEVLTFYRRTLSREGWSPVLDHEFHDQQTGAARGAVLMAAKDGTGCQITIDAADGTEIDVEFTTLAKHLPGDIPVYTASVPITVHEAPQGLSLVAATQDNAETIQTFYYDQFPRHGWELIDEPAGFYWDPDGAKAAFVKGHRAVLLDIKDERETLGFTFVTTVVVEPVSSETSLIDFLGPEGRALVVQDDHLYLGQGDLISERGGIQIFQTSDAALPEPIGRLDLESPVRDLVISDDHAYVAMGGSTTRARIGLCIVDVSDPREPQEVAFRETRAVRAVSLNVDMAYVACAGDGLKVFDVSTPSSPSEVSGIRVDGSAEDVCCQGDFAFVANESKGLSVIDVSDPNDLRVVATVPALDLGPFERPSTSAVEVAGEYAYVGHSHGMTVFDVSDPANPVLVQSLTNMRSRRHTQSRGRFSIFPSRVYRIAVTDRLLVLGFEDSIGLFQIPEDPTHEFQRLGCLQPTLRRKLINSLPAITIRDSSVFAAGDGIICSFGLPPDGYVVGTNAPTIPQTPSVLPVPTASGDDSEPDVLRSPFSAEEANLARSEWADHFGVQPLYENSLGISLVLVPPGTYEMGSLPDEDGRDDDEMRHTVRITRPFYMSTYEITKSQFREFDKHGGWRISRGGTGIDLRPPGRIYRDSRFSWENIGFGFGAGYEDSVVNISWDDAVAFCRWLSREESSLVSDNIRPTKYRLPTEAEWEYACRAGTETAYWCGDDPERLLEVDNVKDEGLARRVEVEDVFPGDDGTAFLSNRQHYPANAFGLFAMHGDVSEWCVDVYVEDYESLNEHDPVGTASNPLDRDQRNSIRGGSFVQHPKHCRSASRFEFDRDYQHVSLGFRVVAEIELP